ncbi:MAG: hypothetical protein RL033_7787, partial [Pseudomonadota bacterium]
MRSRAKHQTQMPLRYTFANAGIQYVPADALVGMGIAVSLVSAAVANDPLAAFCSVDSGGRLRRVKPQTSGGQDFLTVAAALRDLPDQRIAILDHLCPGKLAPALPMYTVNGCDGEWVTAADLSRCTGMQSHGLLAELGIRTSRTAKCFAIVDSDGSLTRAGTCRARGCGAMVAVAWVLRNQKLAKVHPLLKPAIPGVPIAMAAPPIVQHAGRQCKRPREGGSLSMCSVKMTVTARLKDPAARQFLESVVDCVSHASRFGSYLLNLHVMRLLDQSGGLLPDTPAQGPFCLSKLARKAMAAARFKQPKDAALAATFTQHPVMAALVDSSLPDVGNTLSHEALDYVKNAYTTLQEAGPSRLASLMKAAWNASGDTDRAGRTQAVRSLVAFAESRAASLPGNVPAEIAALAEKYRGIYTQNGLPVDFGVHASQSAADKDRKVRRILELYWHISRDLDALPNSCSKPVSGTFSYLPVSSLKRRHVTIDNAGFARAASTVVHGMDVRGLEPEAFASLFVSGPGLGRRKDVTCIRSPSQGWAMGKSFKTDGTSLVVMYVKSVAKQQPPIPEPLDLTKCRIVGDDPGRVNMHTTCEKRPDGEVIFRQLTRADYYRDAKLDGVRVSSERRHQQHASEALAALSGTVKRTTDPLKFEAYVQQVARHAPALRAAYASRSACSEAFQAFSLKTKTIDRFIMSHGRSELDCPLVYGLGDAKFKSGGRGERSVPTTSYASRIRAAYSHRMILVPVDEYGTTKYCCATHTELAPAWRPAADGTKLFTDRDVKLCKSEAITALGSPHPCQASPDQVSGLSPFAADKCVPIDRDRNAALAIAHLTGVAPEHRPPVYRRPSVGQPCRGGEVTIHSRSWIWISYCRTQSGKFMWNGINKAT